MGACEGRSTIICCPPPVVEHPYNLEIRVDSGWRRTSCSKNEEHGEEDAEDDDRNFSFSKHLGGPPR